MASRPTVQCTSPPIAKSLTTLLSKLSTNLSSALSGKDILIYKTQHLKIAWTLNFDFAALDSSMLRF